MTIDGTLSGSSDAVGSWASEALAEFGYFSNDGSNIFIPVDFLDVQITGGPSFSNDAVIRRRRSPPRRSSITGRIICSRRSPRQIRAARTLLLASRFLSRAHWHYSALHWRLLVGQSGGKTERKLGTSAPTTTLSA
ncbi:MAG: hypothetical protein WAN51_13135 [Alphaproteobacteria bacterium]